jgi:hypothetical protein
MPDDWEAFYGLNASDPSDATQDPDDDGVSNVDEFGQGTVPTDGPPPPDTDATPTACPTTGRRSTA